MIMGDGRAACGPPGTKAAILGGLLSPTGEEGGRRVEDREVDGEREKEEMKEGQKEKREGRMCHGIIPSHAPPLHPHPLPQKRGGISL